MIRAIDPKCRELAEHFMRDERVSDQIRDYMTAALAEEVQIAVESWMMFATTKVWDEPVGVQL